jgi:hypothetical protein
MTLPDMHHQPAHDEPNVLRPNKYRRCGLSGQQRSERWKSAKQNGACKNDLGIS